MNSFVFEVVMNPSMFFMSRLQKKLLVALKKLAHGASKESSLVGFFPPQGYINIPKEAEERKGVAFLMKDN